MHTLVNIRQCMERQDGTELVVFVPKMRLGDLVRRKRICNAELRFDDGRHISVEQRKKAYATIRDIADWAGYLPEEMKEHLKYEHMIRTGDAYFSLSNCSMDTAREFINTILEFSLENGVPLSEDAVGMGNNRNRIDDSSYRKICLCRKHHTVAHQMGVKRFREMYKVYGITVKDM